jgi:hypothetical protein
LNPVSRLGIAVEQDDLDVRIVIQETHRGIRTDKSGSVMRTVRCWYGMVLSWVELPAAACECTSPVLQLD